MQQGVVEAAVDRDTVVGNIGNLVTKARQEKVPVVWFQYSDEQLITGSDNWQIIDELSPDDMEPLIEKSFADPFEETSLESTLADLAVGRIFVVGAQTDECIRATLHGAIVRGYDAILVTNMYWGNHRAPGRTAGTVRTDEVNFG
jgi:nicotinamidase-related amidase